METDLEDWLKGLGHSKAEIVPIYASILQENGIAARLLSNLTASVFPISSMIELKPEELVEVLGRTQSPEYAAWLLEQPEPTPEELAELSNCIDALPNLRQHFLKVAKVGPRYKRGGRPRELGDQETREEIRAKIKERREPGIKLQDIFKRLGLEYGVSVTTIKRIWQEKPIKKNLKQAE